MPGSIDDVSLVTELCSVTFTDLRPAQVAGLKRFAAERRAATDLAIELLTGTGRRR